MAKLARPYEDYALEVYFRRWSLNPEDPVDQRIADLLRDMGDRGGFSQLLDRIEQDAEVKAEIVADWREILSGAPGPGADAP